MQFPQAEDAVARGNQEPIGISAPHLAGSAGCGGTSRNVRQAQLDALTIDFDGARRPGEKPVDPRREHARGRGRKVQAPENVKFAGMERQFKLHK